MKLDLFNIDEEKYPLLKEVEDYILEATMEKGDCIFLPALYWTQYQTQGELSTILTFEYQPSSKYVDILFRAVNEGLHLD